MYPTGVKMYDAALQYDQSNASARIGHSRPDASTYIIEVAAAAGEPLREFLKPTVHDDIRPYFTDWLYRGLPEEYRASLKPDDFIVLYPPISQDSSRMLLKLGY